MVHPNGSIAMHDKDALRVLHMRHISKSASCCKCISHPSMEQILEGRGRAADWFRDDAFLMGNESQSNLLICMNSQKFNFLLTFVDHRSP